MPAEGCAKSIVALRGLIPGVVPCLPVLATTCQGMRAEGNSIGIQQLPNPITVGQSSHLPGILPRAGGRDWFGARCRSDGLGAEGRWRAFAEMPTLSQASSQTVVRDRGITTDGETPNTNARTKMKEKSL